MPAERVLIVDDEPGVRSALEGILADEGYVVTTASSGEDGLEAASRAVFDAIFLDIWLPGMDGLATLQRLREAAIDAEVVMISGHGTIDTAVRATKLGAFDFVEKPLSLEKTLLVLRNALRQRKLARVNTRLLEQVARDTEIVGAGAAAERLRRLVEIAAGSPAPVLILGETGTGRETVARRIHALSAGADAPFVEVPCGVLHSGGLTDVLTGATGRGRLAAGGTLFLEDVDRLAPAAQEELAGVLVAVLAAERAPRIVASAARPLAAPLAGSPQVLTLQVPPLRERREDVPRFVERFLRELSREYAREVPGVSPATMETLQRHDWPGNVRELRNLCERLLLFGGDPIEPSDLPESLGGADSATQDLYRPFPTLADGIAAFREHYLRRTMAECDGDLDRAATKLGIAVAELRSLLARG